MKHIIFFLLLCSISLFSTAQWTTDTINNTELASVNSSDIVTPDVKGDLNFMLTWIAFYSYNQITSNYDMRVQLLDTYGNKLYGDSGLVISTKNSGTATFVFNACEDQSNHDLYVAFQYLKGSIYVTTIQKVTAGGGLPWGSDGIDLGPGLSPYPAILSTGEIAVAWNNDGVINYQKLSSDGVRVWDSAKEIRSTTGHTVTRAQVVAHNNGTFGIVYQDLFAFPIYTNLFMQRVNNDGTAIWNNGKQISTLTTSAARYYDVTTEKDTTYIGYYGTTAGQNNFKAFLQKIKANGNLPFGKDGASFTTNSDVNDPSELTINITHTIYNPILHAVSTFTNPGQTESGIYLQEFNINTGERLLGDSAKEIFPVSTELKSLTGSGLKNCGYGAPLIFAFTDINNKLYATGLDEAGNFTWTNQFTALCSTTNTKSRFGLMQIVSGIPEEGTATIAVWQEDKGNGDRPYAQEVSCNGIAGGSLPVTLLNFTGSKAGSSINLSWQTATETNNRGFYIERSADGRNFSNIGFVASKATDGNSTLKLSYSFTDVHPLSLKNYYRLKQMDKDGKTTYSNIIKIEDIMTAVVLNIYPNPVHQKLYIKVPVSSSQKVSIIITDATGKLIKHQEKIFTEGNNIADIDVSSFQQGIYFLQLKSDMNIKNAVQRFVKQ